MMCPLVLIFAVLACVSSLPGQVEGQDTRAEKGFRRRCAGILCDYAARALRDKVRTRSKQAFEEILRHYDADHRHARRALGFTKANPGWRASRVPLDWSDEADDDRRHDATTAWHVARMKLARLHRERGLRLAADNAKLGAYHLARAIDFDPHDAAAHAGLGHDKATFGGVTYSGTKAQLEFIRTMLRLERTALILAQKDYELRPVAEIPAELAVLGAEFHGARSEHFVVFARGPQRNAENCARWAERALEFLQFALGAKRAERFRVVKKQAIFGWRGFVWTKYERERLIELNRQRYPESEFVKRLASVEQQRAAGRFVNIQWYVNRKSREISQKLTPAMMHDRIVQSVWEFGIAIPLGVVPKYQVNDPLVEGVLQAATWYLLATAINKRGTLPDGTSSQPETELPDSIHWWVRAMRDQAIAGTDVLIRDVARRSLARYPNDARLKAWSFMTFAMARYPDTWHEFVMAVPGDKIPFPEEVDAAAERVFGRELAAVEDEWRQWASGRSITAIATGYGPPLLPDAPSREQLAGLRRLNELRRQAGLAPCELDLEATVACVAHARYLAKHPAHWKWPEAHEQNPALPGFTARGMRCGLRSVIVLHAKGAAASVDNWFGTVYHRFPLLAQNIRRVGFALEGGMCVLDTGSLAEPSGLDKGAARPIKKWIVWPPDGAAKVPRQFAYEEFPNPLGDVPPPNNRDHEAGYPVSLTMAGHVHPEVVGADIRLFRMQKRGRGWERCGAVKVHVHTPQKPLLSRNETLDSVFAIPFRTLDKKTRYQVVVTLQRRTGGETIRWSFTTGSAGLR